MPTPSLAVAGAGYWGKNLVRNFHQLGALAAVCEPSTSGQELTRQLAPEVRLYQHFDEVLSDAGIQAVVIATPAITHFELCSQALQAGKDVFCEKPLALNYRQAAELVRLAREHERILMVGHILEYHPAILALRQLVATGELGTIRYLYSNRLNLGKIRREENILWSFAPHDLAVILRLIGELPFQVIAHGGSYIQPNIADVTMTQLAFDNGVSAHIFVSWLNPFKEQKLVVVGSRKMAVFDDVAKSLMLFDQRVDIREGEPVPVKGEGSPVAFAADEPLRLECQAFLAAIESRQAPITDGESGLRVLKVLQAAQRSLITNGQTILLPME
ncbi:MAG: oxidoreductase [Candidatus Melainabacteria bacterium HGW-Melainabacteria-1]|nr:MAG: oxidoreductase [Candidatus Melainabacteria bacterium HGW-Melainabacteria-1]